MNALDLIYLSNVTLISLCKCAQCYSYLIWGYTEYKKKEEIKNLKAIHFLLLLTVIFYEYLVGLIWIEDEESLENLDLVFFPDHLGLWSQRLQL